MERAVVWLLKHRTYLGRITLLAAIIPFYLSSIPALTQPMLLAAGMIFLTLNWKRLKSMLQNFYSAHFWLKLQYFWFAVGAVVFYLLLKENFKDIKIANYIVGLIYLGIYIIWFNKINSRMTREDRRIILKGETTENTSSMDFEPYLIPLLLTLMIVFLIASLKSMIETRAASIFTISTIHWYFPLVVLLVHFLIDIVFVEQIDWVPSGGTTTWKDIEFEYELPDIRDTRKLAKYFEEAAKLPEPPEGSGSYLEENLEFLVKNAQKLDYFPFQLNYVRAMENWGREGRDQIHMMMAIVLASVSQYRFIGLIPIYKRKMFYQGLQVVAMSGSMTRKWRELIEFEVIGKKDEHFVLDWVLGSRYLEFKYNPDWLVSWEGTIYKGKSGYYEAVQKMELMLQIRPEMDQWALDIWELSFEYAQVFIGEDSRKVFSHNLQFYDQLLYLSGKKTIKQYQKEKEMYQQELLNPKNRLVSVSGSHPETSDYSYEEKERIIDAYLFREDQSYETPSLFKTIKFKIIEFGTKVKNLKLNTILQVLGILVLFAVNLGLAYVIDQFVVTNGGFILIAIEVVLLFIFSITPSDSDIKLDDEIQTQSNVLKATTYTQESINITTADINTATIYLFYGIALLLVYRLWLF